MPTPRESKEYFQVQNPHGKVEDTEDGGARIEIDDSEPIGSSEFYANLAEELDENELTEIGRVLLEAIERDKKSREKRDEQYEEGIRRTGMGEDAPGGAQFMGASRVVHPMLTEACVDFAARAMKEIFPANGPAKAFIAGDPTDVDIERGERIADYLNYQFVVQMPEARSEIEQMCTQMPLGGGQYIKATWNDRKKRPNLMFVSIDDIYLPFAASNFYAAERKTHVQYITEMEYAQRIANEMYRDVSIVDVMIPQVSKTEEANQKVEGKEPNEYNEDGLRTIYECFCMHDIEKEEQYRPYVISIDKETSKVLAIYRNWDEEDEKFEELTWIVEFPFIPWRGAYPIGLTHMIGGLSGAATGALRSLLDSALINNFPGLLKLKGGTSGGQTERIDPTQVLEVEGSIQDDDVRKLVMPMPYSPPSPVLFELLGFLVDAGKSVIRTNMEETQDNNENVPVGTTMARLEQGMMVYSAIHGRLHDAMGKLLKVMYRINKFYLEEQEVFDDTGKLLVKRQDFDGPMTAVPVSDPNIFSESQRFAQIQLVAQRAQMLPQLYDLRKVEELILERMKIPNVDDLLLPKQEGQETNAVNENIASSMGRPIVAFPEQDHLAHLQVHLEFITNPMLGMNQSIAPKALPILLEHLNEHMVLWYATRIFDVASEAAGVEINELQRKATVEERKAFDQMLAEASRVISPQVEQQFQQLPPVIQKCQQMLAQLQQPPQDPATQLGYADIQSREKIAGMQVSSEQQKMAQQAQVENMKAQHQKEIEMLKAQAKQMENQFKGEIEKLKLSSSGQIEGAKLQEQGRQADQVVGMEQFKQEQENVRKKAELETQILLADKKAAQDRDLQTLKGAHEMQKADKDHANQIQQKHMDMQSAHALEDKKQQGAQALEDKKGQTAHSLERTKQDGAQRLEGSKQEHAAALEGMKAEGAQRMEKSKQDHAMKTEQFKHGGEVQKQAIDIMATRQSEQDTREHEEKMQRKADALQVYSEGQQHAHDKDMKGAELVHQSAESEKERKHTEKESQKERDHTSSESEKDRKHAGELEETKAKHDMDKTKMQEATKAKTAKDQLKVKEHESKENIKIKQAESKEKMKLKGIESKVMLGFKEKEASLGLKVKEQQAKQDSQYSAEEHKGKMGLLKTKTSLAEKQLREGAKYKSEHAKAQAKQKMKDIGKKDKK